MKLNLLTFTILLLTFSGALAQSGSVQLEEKWRQGGDEGELFFGNVLQVLPTPAGGVYVLDTQLVQIFQLDAGGQLVAVRGGQGDGPGEVNNINSMVSFPDGRLGLGQVLPGKVVCLDGRGDPVGSIGIRDREDSGSAFVLFMQGWPLADHLLSITMQWRMQREGFMNQEMSLRSYDMQGNPLVDFICKSTEFDLSRFVFTEDGFDFVWNRCVVTPSSEVVFAPNRDEYLLHYCAPDGRLIRKVQHEARLHDRTRLQKEEARRSHAAIASQYGRPVVGVEAAETDPAITGLAVLEEGRIWVRTGRGDRSRPAGVLTTVDELGSRGEFRRRLALLAPGDPARDALHILPDGRVIVVVGAVQAYRRETNTEAEGGVDEETVLEVICYEPVG
jgi:hypothetical protein